MQFENKKVQMKRKKRKKGFLGYFLLFVIVFTVTLSGLYYFVNSYSPSVDVSIGNEEALTFAENDVSVEMKTVDERLKWIQMEDEMPSVAIRETLNNDEQILKKQKEKKKEKDLAENKIEPPKPAMSDIVKQSADFRTVAKQAVIPVQSPNVPVQSQVVPSIEKPVMLPAPIPSLTKVYIGAYSTIDEAMSAQQKIATDIPESMPFIKSVNGSYIVQLGSFSNKEIADSFILKVREKGYSPKILSGN